MTKVETLPMDVMVEIASAIVERQFYIDNEGNSSSSDDEHTFTDTNGDIRYIEPVQDEFNKVLDIIDSIANPEV